MKILVALHIPKIGIDLLRDKGLKVTVYTDELPMPYEQLIEATQQHDILLSSSQHKLDSEFLIRNDHLKLISQFAVGYDNIDLKKASEIGILVANTPNAMIDATADIAFALLLSVSRKTFYMHKKMKPSSIFINTARGGIHNEKDLIKALQKNTIWGSGLDVTNPEPMAFDNPLLSMANVAVTPHIGSATVEARNEMSRLAAMNIIQFTRGEKITNLVVP